MSATYRSSSFAANAAGTDVTSVSPSKPTGTIEGDGMVAIVAGFQAGSGVSAPSGWTAKQTNVTSSTGLRVDIYTKVAGGSEPSSYTFSRLSGSGSMSAVIITVQDISFNDWEANLWTSAVDNGTSTSATPNFTTALQQSELFFSGVCYWRNGTLTASGSAGWTEIQEFMRQDGAPGTNYRGQSVYRCNSLTTGGNSPASNTITLSATPSGQIEWAVSFLSRVETTSGASTHSGATSSGTGSITSQPTGSGTSTHSGATSSGTAYEYPTAEGSSTLSGVTSAGTGYEYPTGSGTSLLGGITSSGEVEVSGTFFEVEIDGVWENYTPYVLNDPGVFIQRGRTDSGSTAASQYATFTMFDRDDPLKFIPTNKASSLYGKWKKNTKIRITRQESGVRFVGEANSFDIVKLEAGAGIAVAVQAFGILHRLEQGDAPERSAMTRNVLNVGGDGPFLAAYWPCEDGTDAVEMTSEPTLVAWDPFWSIPNLRMTHMRSDTGSKPSSYSGLDCTLPIPQIGESRWQSTPITPVTLDGGGVCAFLLASPGGMTNGSQIIRMWEYDVTSAPDSSGWTLSYDSTDTLELYIGTEISGSSGTATVDLVGRKDGVLIMVAWEGSQAHLYAHYPEEDEPTLLATVGSAGSLGNDVPMVLTVNATNHEFNEASSAYLGQISVWKDYDTASPVLPAIDSVGAYRGETAGRRFERICDEEGFTFTADGDLDETTRMGVQKPANSIAILRECERSDQGIMYELRGDFGLGYTTRRALYNQSATATFDWDSAEFLEDGFTPKYDDQGSVNRMTITREDGAAATYENSASVSDFGLYESSDTVSLHHDDDCYAQAGWRVHLGTHNEVRVTSMRVAQQAPSFKPNESLRVAVQNLNIGRKVVIDNPASWVQDSGSLEQLVVGYTESWNSSNYEWTFAMTPEKPYQVARAGTDGGTVYSRVSWTGARVNTLSPYDTNDTEIDVSVNPAETVSVDDGPFDIEINGERMTVTAVDFVGSSVWTFTVTRAVNGVSRTIENGDRVKMWAPAYVAL